MVKYTFMSLSVTLFGIFCSFPQDVPHLKKIDTLPKIQHNLYFKTIPFISIDETGSIYASDNGGQAVYKIDLIRDEVKTFAQKGQGPGEVQLPAKNFIVGNTLFVKDNTGINLFDTNGKFLSRFRTFERVMSIGADSETVYLIQPGSEHLIHAYSYKGERKNIFGYKYPFHKNIYKGWEPSFVDYMLNNGKVIVGRKYIFFISYVFSEIFKYDLSGTLIDKQIIEDDELCKTNRDDYLVKGQDMPANGEFHIMEIVIDGCYFNGNLYILRSFINKEKKRDVIMIKMSEDDIHSIHKIYFEREENMDGEYMRSMCIGGANLLQPHIYISLYDKKNEDFLIKIFQEER